VKIKPQTIRPSEVDKNRLGGVASLTALWNAPVVKVQSKEMTQHLLDWTRRLEQALLLVYM
jgi:hypothetical protein